MKTRFNLQPWREAQRQAKQKKFITTTAIIAIAAIAVLGFNYYIESNYIDDQNSAQSYLQQEVAGLQSAKKKRLKIPSC